MSKYCETCQKKKCKTCLEHHFEHIIYIHICYHGSL